MYVEQSENEGKRVVGHGELGAFEVLKIRSIIDGSVPGVNPHPIQID